MIDRIQLSHFRKHENLDITLGPGLTAVRGSNEAGKSTLTEGVAYALFGSKALRTPLADAVTWGKPESALKVELTLTLEGRTYTFKRSKGGAEVTENGNVHVTGQNEVSAFAASILGVDVGAAARLMVANQNGLRGSLEQGPKATAQMIEELSDFDLFDRLIDRMQDKLLLGNPGALEAKLADAEAALAAAPKPTPFRPDEFDKQAAVALARAGAVEKDISERLDPALRAAAGRLDSAKILQRMHDQVSNDLRRARDQKALHEQQKKDADAAASKTVRDSELSTIREQIADMNKLAERRTAYSAFSLWQRPELEWEGDFDSLAAEIKAVRDRESESRKVIADSRGDIRALESQRITSSACGICGKDISELPEVIEKNAGIDENIRRAKGIIEVAEARVASAAEELATLESVAAKNREAQGTVMKCLAYIELDTNFVPPVMKWIGGEVDLEAKPDIAALKSKLSTIESARDAATKAQARASALAEALADDTAQVARLEANLLDYPAVAALDELRREVEEADVEISAAKAEAEEARREAEAAAQAKREAEAAYARDVAALAALQSRVNETKTELTALAFNNTLMKKVRAARPIIADKLWNTVLAAVSTLFGQMRGEPSTVTKEKDGFRVNGQAIESLSGSTLDLLGLAIRVALVKTFLPHCPFLILDEPMAACDSDRSASMLGFIQGCGFPQVLLVTHEEASEAMADNLVTL